MSSQPVNTQTARPIGELDGLHTEASAIVFLLTSLEASLQAHAVGNSCVDIVKACIARIQKDYCLAEQDAGEAIVWNEADVDGIMRLLDYARWEVRERLNDLRSFEELGSCLDRLANPIRHPQ